MNDPMVNPARAGITILLPPTWPGGLPAVGSDGFRRLVILLVLAVILMHGYPGAA